MERWPGASFLSRRDFLKKAIFLASMSSGGCAPLPSGNNSPGRVEFPFVAEVLGFKKPRLLWEKTGMPLEGLRIVANNQVVVLEEPLGRMSAYDARAGNELWQRPRPDENLGQWHKGLIYALSKGLLVALDEATGQESWRFPLLGTGESISSRRQMGDDALLFQVTDSKKWRFVPIIKEGRELWRKDLPSKQLFVNSSKYYTVFQHQQSRSSSVLYRLDQKTGEQVWKREFPGYRGSDFAERPYLTVDTAGKVALLNLETGEIVWEKEGKTSVWSTRRDIIGIERNRQPEFFGTKTGRLLYSLGDLGPDNSGATVNVGEIDLQDAGQSARNLYLARSGQFTAYNLISGEKRWQTADFNPIGPVYEFGDVFVARVNVAAVKLSSLLGLNAVSGERLWVVPIDPTISSISHAWGMIYAHSADKRIFIDPKDGKTVSELAFERGAKVGSSGTRGDLLFEEFYNEKSKTRGISVISIR